MLAPTFSLRGLIARVAESCNNGGARFSTAKSDMDIFRVYSAGFDIEYCGV